MKDDEINKQNQRIIYFVKHTFFWVTLGLLGLTLIFSSWFVIEPGTRGLVFNTFSGLKPQVYGEGFHFKLPFFDTPILMNIRVQKQSETATAASSDLQDVSTEVVVNFYIDSTKLQEIYRRIGQATINPDYMQSTIMNPVIQESIKSVTALHTAENLIKQRPLVKQEIDQVIASRLEKYGILVNDVSITNFKFSDTFTQAIEAKVTAEQNALKEQNNLKVVEFQAQQKVETAKGDAQAIEIINQELIKSPQYISYLTVQKWNGVSPLSVGGSNTLLGIYPTSIIGNSTR